MTYFCFSSGRRHTRWTGDWSSDVCSSDLARPTGASVPVEGKLLVARAAGVFFPGVWAAALSKIGRASCRERVEISVVDGSYKQKIKQSSPTRHLGGVLQLQYVCSDTLAET